MKVLVTGGVGFIGTRVVTQLRERGHEAIVLDTTSAPGAITFSVCDAQAVGTLFQLVKPEAIIHLAAIVGVDRTLREQFSTVSVNINGTLNVLQGAMKLEPRPRVFIASSSEVYGVEGQVPLQEDAAFVFTPRPRWTYAFTKVLDEQLAGAAAEQYALDVVVGRFFNVTGPGHPYESGMVLPRFVEAALRNEPIRIFNGGTQTRSFVHVDEAARAVIELTLGRQRDRVAAGVFNIGGMEEVSIRALADRVRRAVPESTSSILDTAPENPERGIDTPRRVPDLSRLRAALGWAPSIPLDRIIVEMVADRRDRRAGRTSE